MLDVLSHLHLTSSYRLTRYLWLRGRLQVCLTQRDFRKLCVTQKSLKGGWLSGRTWFNRLQASHPLMQCDFSSHNWPILQLFIHSHKGSIGQTNLHCSVLQSTKSFHPHPRKYPLFTSVKIYMYIYVLKSLHCFGKKIYYILLVIVHTLKLHHFSCKCCGAGSMVTILKTLKINSNDNVCQLGAQKHLSIKQILSRKVMMSSDPITQIGNQIPQANP